jgi:hypothetical protein
MKEIFIKKHWYEEDTLFYMHFQDGRAVRQIEISPSGIKYLSLKNPVQGESALYDQSLDDLELDQEDFISENEFETAWKKQQL